MTEPTPTDPPPPPPAPPSGEPGTPAPPPVSEIVLTAPKNEREVQLEKELEAERQSRKKVELDNAQLQDQLHQLKSPPAPTDPPRKKSGPLGVRVKK